MNVRQWQEIEAVFLRALECDPESRLEFLQSACNGDAAKLAEVNKLLNGVHPEVDFLESWAGAEDRDADVLNNPKRIGPYRILHLIRRGGMGAVYLAVRDDDTYRKQVAVKLIRRGFDHDSILRRFRRERQILASLDHPNIARLLDGGVTEDGLPYLVMEYIEGKTLTRWAEEQKLSIAEKLKLFRKVCAAVHYAHQRLVIHLDIKPANILVSAEGEPKLLDFGISRLLDPGIADIAGDTLTLQRPVTPDYASPEQIRGETATITSDIYSLGVVLFELLAGELPRKLSGLPPAQMQQELIATRIPCVSAVATRRIQGLTGARLHRQIAEDLDNIVYMAMRRDPQRRYASAAELSEDIGRHLGGFPVIARRDTFFYRSRKFLGRNRAGVAAGLVVCFSLIVGMIATTWQARIAARQRGLAQANEQRADQRLNDALQLTHALLFDYHDALAGLSGSTPVRMRLIQDTVAYLERLESEASDSPGVRRQLALAYLKIGDVQGRPYVANLGDTAGALLSYRHATALLGPLAVANPGDDEVAAELGSAYDDLGRLNVRMLNYGDAEANFRISLSIRQRIAGTHVENAQDRAMVASTWEDLGDVCEYRGELKEAYSAFEQAETLWRALSIAKPSDLAVRKGWAASLERVGAIHETIAIILSDSFNDRIDAFKASSKALDSYLSSLAIAQNLVVADPANVTFLRMEADAGVYAARMLSRRNAPRDSLPLLRRSVSIFSDLAVADPANHESQFDLMDAQCALSSLLASRGETKAAVSLFDRSVARGMYLLRADPEDKEWRRYLDTKFFQFQVALASSGALQEALRIGKERFAFDEDQATTPSDPTVEQSSYLSGDLLFQAKLLEQSHKPKAARVMALRAIAMARTSASSRNAPPDQLAAYGSALLTCVPVDLRNSLLGLHFLQASASKAPLSIEYGTALARAYALTGDRARALATLRELLARLPWPPEARQQATVESDLDSMITSSR